MTQDNSISAARGGWAASFIDRGLSVLILHDVSAGRCSCLLPATGLRWDGKPCPEGSQGKHPRAGNWRAAGLSVMAQVESELARYPAANLGILTGQSSGVWVLDVDPRHDGHLRLAELIAQYGPLPATYTVRTGSGGWHYYFALPYDFAVTNANRLPVGLDTRGDGGQVVAPGSVTLFGSYSVELDVPPAQAPGWLLDLVRPQVPTERATAQEYAAWREMPAALMEPGDDSRLRTYAATAVSRELAALEDAVPGSRGSTAFKVACALIELCNSPWAGLSPALVRAAYDRAADVAMVHGGGFDEAEASQSWNSAARRVGHTGRAVPPELDAGGVVPLDGAGVPPFGGAASTATPPAGGLANPFALPQQRTGGESTGVHGSPRESADAFERAVAGEMSRQAIVAEARRRLAEQRESVAMARERLSGLLLDTDGLDNVPALEPLVEGWLSLDSVARVNGESGSGKSFVMIDIAGCVGTGVDWQGSAVHKGDVVYLVAEGARGIRKRVRAWEKAYNRRMTGVRFLPVPVQAGSAEWTALVEVCREIRPALVVLDTQARITVGVEENSATEMGIVVDAVERLRTATGACVALVHHTGTGGGERGRGSTAVKGAVQTELFVSKNRSEITVSQGKQKDDEEAPDLLLVMQPVQIGDDVTSVALKRSMLLSGSTGRPEPVAVLNQVFAEVFNLATGGTKAEVKAVVLTERALMSRSAFFRAWNELEARGNIGKIAGTQSWRHIPVEDRSKLIEPTANGNGFMAPR